MFFRCWPDCEQSTRLNRGGKYLRYGYWLGRRTPFAQTGDRSPHSGLQLD